MKNTTRKDGAKQWFVMRDLRRVNAKDTAYSLLVRNGMEAFTPMSVVKNKKTGNKELVPLLHWLVFVHAAKEEIDDLIIPSKPIIPYLQYILQKGKPADEGGLVVSEKSMNYFRIALSKQNFPLVYHYNEITPNMRGRRVLVVSGDMIGYMGHLQKFTGGRNMKLFVELEGFCLAPIQIKPEDIVFIDENDTICKKANDESTNGKETMHYSRMSRITDIVNFLRFGIPQDIKAMSDIELANMMQVYKIANEIFEENDVKSYLYVDKICNDKIKEITVEIKERDSTVTFNDEAPIIQKIKSLCSSVC